MELFKESEMASKSPRLKWLEKYDIKTNRRAGMEPDCQPWDAWSGDYNESLDSALNDTAFYHNASPVFAIGETEEEAIDNLARNRGIELPPA